MNVLETPRPPKSLPAPDGWRPIASFVVDFQIRVTSNQRPEQRVKVHHIESDSCVVWLITDCPALCAWMMEKVNRRHHCDCSAP